MSDDDHAISGGAAGPKPREIWAAGAVDFRDYGTVSPRGRVPILESLEDPHSVVGEELRFLRSKVQEICNARGLTCLALTSALPGEGKTTLSAGLASALARQPGKRVILVEADLRRPALTSALDLPPVRGLSDWLHGNIDHLPIRLVAPGGFYVLMAGETPLEQPELLGSPRMESALRVARERFDFVLLDAMPLLPVADAALLQDLVDGFLLVVRSRSTPRDALQKGIARIRSDRIVGLVLNDHREIIPSYTAYAYSRYGMDDAPRPSAEKSDRRPRRWWWRR